MLPPPAATMPGSTCLHTSNVPLRLMPSTRSHSASSMSIDGAEASTPAAFTTTSIAPAPATTDDDRGADRRPRRARRRRRTRRTALGHPTRAPRDVEADHGRALGGEALHARGADARRAPVTSATLPSSRPRHGFRLARVRAPRHVRGQLAAAVHEHVRAGHVARERRREEQAHVGDVGRVGHAPERHGLADRRDALLVAVEEVRLLGDDEADDDRVDAHLRRELDRERLRRVEQPGLGRAVRRRCSGDGRTPLTLAMLTMLPPSSWSCITAFAVCANTSGAVRFSAMIARGEARRRRSRCRPAASRPRC